MQGNQVCERSSEERARERAREGGWGGREGDRERIWGSHDDATLLHVSDLERPSKRESRLFLPHSLSLSVPPFLPRWLMRSYSAHEGVRGAIRVQGLQAWFSPSLLLNLRKPPLSSEQFRPQCAQRSASISRGSPGAAVP